jgi:ubiquinone/menaquinone biosynthesis C-methylase UbiE
MDEVQQRFSRNDAAHKWNDLYSRTDPVLEEVSFRQRRDFTIAQILETVPAGGRVLDLGCGTGPVVAELRRLGFDCVGLDYSQDMLEFAKQRLRASGLDDSQILQGDCRHTPFPDARFDAVVCLGVISYVENYEVVLAEIRRILKPGGVLVVSFRNRFNPVLSDPVSVAKQIVKRLIGRREYGTYTIGQFLDHRIFLRKVSALDYRFLSFRGIGFGPFRVAGRAVCGELASVRLSRGLESVLRGLRMNAIARWMADVSVWVYRSPVPGQGREEHEYHSLRRYPRRHQ